MTKIALRTALIALLLAAVAAAQDQHPVFPNVDLIGLDGTPSKLPSLFGKATVLNFWATWCGPCRMELPELQKLYNGFAGRGLAVLAIDVDGPGLPDEVLLPQLGELRSRIDGFMRTSGLSLPVYVMDAEAQRTVATWGLLLNRIPTTLLLDGAGKVVVGYQGYSAEGMQDLRQQVDALLGGGSGKGGT